MLDLAGILVSSVVMLIVIVRAVKLDRNRPWFQTVKPKDVQAPLQSLAWRRKA